MEYIMNNSIKYNGNKSEKTSEISSHGVLMFVAKISALQTSLKF
jgi:hypothetical protein